MALFSTRSKIGILLACIVAAFVFNMYPSIDPPKRESQIAVRQSAKDFLPPPKYCSMTNVIAMTFNGGIHQTNTPLVLNALRDQKIQATFFLSPEWAGTTDLTNLIIKRVFNEGHTIGFQWWGSDPRTLSDADLKDNLLGQATKIKNVIGKMPLFFRYPFGQTDDRVNNIAASLGFIQIGVGIDSLDYNACDPKSGFSVANAFLVYTKAISAYQGAGTQYGSLISSHTDLCPIDSEINYIASQIKATFNYSFVAIDKCLGLSYKYLENTGSNTGTVGSTDAGTTKKSSFEGYTRLAVPTWLTLTITYLAALYLIL